MASVAKNNRSTTSRLVFTLLILAMAAGILLFRQQIIDQFNYYEFQPSSDVAALAARDELSDTGKFYFYSARPQIEDRTTFNNSCDSIKDETTVVLGCYAGQRIYVFDVKDAQIDGIKEVTAAHEMLHAAYDRLSDSERSHVDSLLEAQAAKITDPSIVSLLKAYDKTEPGERVNELHSIIGTQVANISPELESYYSRYFKDRSVVVGLYNKYEGVFNSLKSQQDELSDELDQLSAQITGKAATYNQDVAQLNADIESFNHKASSGGFANQGEFNSDRNALIARQASLSQEKTDINNLIDDYNKKRAQLAAINSQAEALNRSINSNLNPLPTI